MEDLNEEVDEQSNAEIDEKPSVTWPRFRIGPGLIRGQRMSVAQRTSSHFNPEPHIGHLKIRQGIAPPMVGEDFFERNATTIIRHMRAGSIVVEVQSREGRDWEKLPTPTHKQFQEFTLARDDHRRRELTEELVEASETTPSEPAAAEPTLQHPSTEECAGYCQPDTCPLPKVEAQNEPSVPPVTEPIQEEALEETPEDQAVDVLPGLSAPVEAAAPQQGGKKRKGK